MQTVLTFLHSNAGIERLLSLVKKNKKNSTDTNRLDIEGSLSSRLTVKFERPESIEKYYLHKPDKELLQNATIKANIEDHTF